ncbi:uncharacterized protein C1orf159 homolog isoform X2 [Pristis pectinata]|uniref:uncharacterized protein C1orf159 homolog isoform X2 n=1 Tax=Pristis pectinata TaxID=685728 RepID=UPI00223D3201|nr:uncharacterized protein C1orf159 homolog isoform X2 [Pristis pectinata]
MEGVWNCRCRLELRMPELNAFSNEVSPLVSSGCCVDPLDELGFCPQSSFCDSDCYRHWFKNGSSTCIRCVNGTSTHSSTNQTECINLRFSSEGKASNGTTVGPTILKIGGPEIAASVCLGTLVIGLLFILSVAAFFYLKRSNKLPYLFYQQGKDSILQPSEMAGMMRSSVRSVRKQRYSRRERLSASVASSAAVSDV